MQIHELNKRKLSEAIVGPGGIVDRIKTTAQTLTKPGGAQALGQALTKNTAELAQSSWTDMYNRTASDRATQTWIDGLLKQYKMQVGNLPVPQVQPVAKPTAQTAKPAEPEEPMYIGSRKLDPKNPKDAELIAQAKAKDLKEAVDLTPEQIAQQFQTWSDQQLNTHSKSGTAITMDQVRNSSIGPKMPLTQLLNKLAQAQSRGDQRQFDELFKQYMNVAAAGIRMLTQQANQASPQATTSQAQQLTTAPGATDIRQQLQTAGISNRQLLKLGELVMAANNGQVRSTGNPAVDDVLRNMGIRI